jgi:peptide deformylase
MAIRNILLRGEAALNKKSREVTAFDDRLHLLLDDMRETLDKTGGLGLAAPQVGILRRAVLVLETNAEDGEEHLVELINPEIISQSGEQDGTEGCLSVPGLYGFVKRPESVTVRAQTRFGKAFEVSGTGITARAFCHELDHLEGLLFTRLTDKLMTPEELDELEQD